MLVKAHDSGRYCPGPTFLGVEIKFSRPEVPGKLRRCPRVNFGDYFISLRCGGLMYGPGLKSTNGSVTRFAVPNPQLADFLIT